jgi:hypothetical protein
MQPSGVSLGKNSLPLQIRLVTSDTEGKYTGVVDRIESSLLSTFSDMHNADNIVICQIIRLHEPRSMEEVYLPVVRTPCILTRQGRSYISDCTLPIDDVERILVTFEEAYSSTEPGRISKQSRINPPEYASLMNLPIDSVIYVPGSRYHIGVCVSAASNFSSPNSVEFTFHKDGTPLWNVQLRTTEKPFVSLSLSWATAFAQFTRMKSGQNHGFSLLIRDFIRNACDVAKAMNNEPVGKKRLFFPGVFDISADARKHYDSKMSRFTSQEESIAGPIRKYNNLVKSCLLAKFVPLNAVVLDACSGHGQDLNKFRNKQLKLLIGTDISEAALTEAGRRYRKGRFSFPAEFVHGNLMLPDAFDHILDVIRSHGFDGEASVDCCSMQLALHYIVGTREHAELFVCRISKLLKSGGVFIATFPCCERISRRLRNLRALNETFSEFGFGNDLYSVTFSEQEILQLFPGTRSAIDNRSQEELEAILSDTDGDEIQRNLSNAWGIQYKFWLVETIDNQEEFIVPLQALTELFQTNGMTPVFAGNFADVLQHDALSDLAIIDDFQKQNPTLKLSDAEEDVFCFYRAVVFRKD